MIDRFLCCFRGFVLIVLEYCSAVWCSVADTHIKLLDRVVSRARFLTGNVFECDIAHHRSVAVLCMMHKIRGKPMHPLYGALPVPYLPVRVTRGALVAHRCTYAFPSCRTSQYRGTSIPPVSVPVERSSCPCIQWYGTGGFKEMCHCFFIGLSCSIPFRLQLFFHFSSFGL